MIIVTRPSPFGEELVKLCQQAQLAARHLPLFTIAKGQDLDHLPSQLNCLQPGDLVVIVSPQVNLMIANPQVRLVWPEGIIYLAIGKRTAQQFQAITAQPTCYPPLDENSEGLIQYWQSRNLTLTGRQVVILCGNNGRILLKEYFSAQGAIVKTIDCYKRHAIDYPATVLVHSQYDYFVVTSMAHLLQLNHYCTTMQKRSCSLIVSSTKIKSAAKLQHWQHIYLAENANNQNLFKTIASLCHNESFK